MWSVRDRCAMQMSAIYLRLYLQKSLLERIREDEGLFTGAEGDSDMLLCLVYPCDRTRAKGFMRNGRADFHAGKVNAYA